MPQPVQVRPGNRSQLGLVRAIAREQAGIVSRAQLLSAGVSRSSIDRALCAGRLHRVHRGVYAAVAPELLTEEGHLVAALLAAGDGALLSHGTAAWRWRIIPAPPSMIELAVPRNHAQTEGLTVFVSRNLRPGRHHPQRPLPDHLGRAHAAGPRRPLRPPRAAQSARGSRVPARPAPRGPRAHLAPRAPGQRQPPRGAEGARPGPRRDEEPPGAPLPRPPHRPRHRASASATSPSGRGRSTACGASSASPSSSTAASTSARTKPTWTTTATSGCAATAT